MLGRMVIPGFAAWLIIGVGTLLVAFVNAIVGGGSLGWPTGLTLLLTTIYCALVVRRRDLGIAIFATAATPGGDLVSPAVLGLSMYVLFELSIVLIRRSGR